MKITDRHLRKIISEELSHMIIESNDPTDNQKISDPDALFKDIKKRWVDRVFPKVQLGDPDFVNSFVREMMNTFRMPNAKGYFTVLEHLFSYRFVPGNEFWFSVNLNAFLARAALFRIAQLKKKGVSSDSGSSLPEVIRQTDESMTTDPSGVRAMALAKELGVSISPASLLQFTFAREGFPGQYLSVWDQARKQIA